MGYTTLQSGNEGFKVVAQRKRGIVKIKLIFHKPPFERFFTLHETLVGRGRNARRKQWKPIRSIWID